MKKHATLTLKNVKNGTRIEFRRDINSLLADTTSSSNLFRSWTTRYSLGGGQIRRIVCMVHVILS